MKIAIIGAGNVGGTLGRRLREAGHDVVYALRNPDDDKYAALTEDGSTRATVEQAVASADATILATPWKAAQAAVESAGDFGGKPLLDATNPIGPGFALTHGHDDSGAEQVARWARNAKVAKVFNTTGAENMANPVYDGVKSVMLACGDDGAREVALALASDLGFEALDAGPLSNARLLEPFAMTWIKLAMQLGQGRGFAFGVLRR